MRKVLRDGREILTGADWHKRKLEVFIRDEGDCKICFKPLYAGHWDVDHIQTRGMGGGKRDDRMENLRLLCRDCHIRRHASNRI